MSGQWDGFTEEDIKNINVGGSKSAHKSTIRTAKLVPIQSKRRQYVKKIVQEKVVQESVLDASIDTKYKENMASKSIPTVDPIAITLSPESHFESIALSEEHVPLPQDMVNVTKSPVEVSSPDAVAANALAPNTSPSHVPVCIRIKEDRSYEVMSSQKMSLAEFHDKQKLMEEQNRHRKELLGRALADRKKQTKAESERLQKIQEELQKLDSLLSCDVSILRNQIEVASLEFSEAQKRYSKAEKEFLEAKIVMYSKLEQKELLTEHLCTIIEQNELRKAKKLSELMQKLELGIITEIPVIEHKSVPPTVCFLNDISDVTSSPSGSNCIQETQTERPEIPETQVNAKADA